MLKPWATPPSLFRKLDEEFGFEVDVCATAENRKCPRFYSPEDDGLRQEWSGVCWMNPPYGREIGLWMRKAWESAQNGATVVCLVPGRTNAPWWHEYVMRASEIRFVRKKVTFVGDKKGVPLFGSVVVIYRPGSESPTVTSWNQPGAVHETQGVLF